MINLLKHVESFCDLHRQTTVYSTTSMRRHGHWSFDSDGNSMEAEGLSLVKTRNKRRVSRRKSSVSTHFESNRSSGKSFVQKVVNGQTMNLRVRRVVRA